MSNRWEYEERWLIGKEQGRDPYYHYQTLSWHFAVKTISYYTLTRLSKLQMDRPKESHNGQAERSACPANKVAP